MTQIHWTKCSERMPPDGMRVIIQAYGEYMKFAWDEKVLNTVATCNTSWTPYTVEKWKELNKY